MPALVRAVFLTGSAFLTASALLTSSSSAMPCEQMVQIERTRALSKTPTFMGEAVRRDLVLEIDILSTSTVPITQLELGIFVGASLETIANTRPAALPTLRPRELADGGLAFRALFDVLILPKSARTLRLDKGNVPLDRELSSVSAVVIDCRVAEGVGDVQRLITPAEPEGRSWIEPLAIGLAVLAILVVLLWKKPRR